MLQSWSWPPSGPGCFRCVFVLFGEGLPTPPFGRPWVSFGEGLPTLPFGRPKLTYSGSRFELRPYMVSDPAKPPCGSEYGIYLF